MGVCPDRAFSHNFGKTCYMKPNTEVRLLPQVSKACGLDMHKDKIVCFISNQDGTEQHMEEFGTFSNDLFKIRDTLRRHQVTHALMESTGIYWVSLYGILCDAQINTTVANPQHIKQIPKRNTDRKDAKWLCTPILHVLARHSFVPGPTQQSLRDLCRNRLFYKQGQTKIKNRIIKILERANIKIRSVVSDISLKTSMEIIRLLAVGTTDIDQLAACCRGRLKAKKEQIEKQITGLVSQQYKEVADCLVTISGIGPQSAQVIISEIGDNMDFFPTADHLTSWCGLAPGNNESAGKHRSTSVKKGNKYLRVAMVTVAWGAVRTKDSYWKALFEQLRKRMKAQKAIIAVARRLLKIIYKTIKTKTMYTEKGFNHFLDLRQRNLDKQKAKLA